MARKLVPDPFQFFNFQTIHGKKESEDVCVLIWIDSVTFANTYLIQVAKKFGNMFGYKSWQKIKNNYLIEIEYKM